MTAPTLEVRGFNVSTFSWQTVNGPNQFRTALTPALAGGANTLIIDVSLEQSTLTSNEVGLTRLIRPTGGYSYDATTVLPAMVQEAKAMGFDVWVKPIVLIGGLASSGPDTYNWCCIQPNSPNQWFSSYKDRLLDIVSLIQPFGADGILLGNELVSMSTNPAYLDQWLDIINTVDTAFSGQIGYNASGFSQPNVYPDELSRVTFIDALDFIGISAYPRLYSTLSPTREQISAGWYSDVYGADNIVAQLRNFISNHPDLNVYFTELGSPATDGGNVMVYDILGNATSDPRYFQRDLPEQQLFFDVALATLYREFGDNLKGVFPYGLNASNYLLEDRPETAVGYTWALDGKPALNTILEWYLGLKTANGIQLSGTSRSEALFSGFYDDFLRGGRGGDSLSGGRGNDTLYGDGLPPLTETTVDISIRGAGALYQGLAPIVSIWVNGEKIGIIDVDDTVNYLAPDGQSWHGYDTYTFKIPGGSVIRDFRIAEENWDGSTEGGHYLHRNFYIDSISVDHIGLIGPWVMVFRDGTEALGAQAIYTDGYLQIDPTAYNATVPSSLLDDDTLDGGTGTDTAVYSGSTDQYRISLSRATHTATVTDTHVGRDGTDSLSNIEKLQFGSQTFDLFNPALTSVPKFGQSRDFLFDAAYYLLCHPDLVTSGVTLQTAFNHYLFNGAAFGYQPNSWFDANYYENRWSDLKASNLDDATLFLHYNLYGVWEGRSAGPKFDQYDGNHYLADYPDVAAYVDAHVADFLGSRSNGAIAHYIIYGEAEGRHAFDLSGSPIDSAILIGVADLIDL